jgi:adenylyl- and sulfurtransferase ThiI
MKKITEQVAGYSYSERIKRIIEIAVKGENASPMEMFELELIQNIREANGECDEVRKSRENQTEL